MINFTPTRRGFMASVATVTAASATVLAPAIAMAAGFGDTAASAAVATHNANMVDLFLWGEPLKKAGMHSGAGAQLHLASGVQSTVWVGQAGSLADRALYEVTATLVGEDELRVQLKPLMQEAQSFGAQLCLATDVTVPRGVVSHVPVTLSNGNLSTLLMAFDSAG